MLPAFGGRGVVAFFSKRAGMPRDSAVCVPSRAMYTRRPLNYLKR